MNLDKFLPQNFDTNLPIALLAGKGDYPAFMWQKIKEKCPNCFIFSFEEENNFWLKDIDQSHCFYFSIGQVGSWLKALKKQQIRYAILAGQITPKRLFHGLKPDLKALYLLSQLKEKNATTIFSSLIYEIEKLGIEVLDARSFVSELLVEPGPLTRNKAKIDKEYLEKGYTIESTGKTSLTKTTTILNRTKQKEEVANKLQETIGVGIIANSTGESDSDVDFTIIIGDDYT